jgi:hypothetical protein
MKKMFFALLLITTISQAQYRLRYDKLFMEAGIGLAVPFSKVSGDGNRPISITHGQGSLRYMFSENVGVLGSLSFDQFENKAKDRANQRIASLELCYNLGNVINLSRNSGGQFGLLIHAGAGVGQISSEYYNSDYVGVFMFGAKPFIAINEKVSIFGDLTYKASVNQSMNFDGHLSNNGTGSQMGITFGFIVALGQNRFHADSAY